MTSKYYQLILILIFLFYRHLLLIEPFQIISEGTVDIFTKYNSPRNILKYPNYQKNYDRILLIVQSVSCLFLIPKKGLNILLHCHIFCYILPPQTKNKITVGPSTNILLSVCFIAKNIYLKEFSTWGRSWGIETCVHTTKTNTYLRYPNKKHIT